MGQGGGGHRPKDRPGPSATEKAAGEDPSPTYPSL